MDFIRYRGIFQNKKKQYFMHVIFIPLNKFHCSKQYFRPTLNAFSVFVRDIIFMVYSLNYSTNLTTRRKPTRQSSSPKICFRGHVIIIRYR